MYAYLFVVLVFLFSVSSVKTNASDIENCFLNPDSCTLERGQDGNVNLLTSPTTREARASSDASNPSIEITSASSDGKKGTIIGKVFDNEGIAEILIDGQGIKPQSNGSFEYQTFVPANGLNIRITATDFSGLSSEKMVFLERSNISQAASITFDRLNPLGRSVRKNDNAIALVVGIANYENTSAKAIYADSDALMFKDYASEKLGIPENRIQTMVNDKAHERLRRFMNKIVM